MPTSIQRILITGASSGIGAELARQLASHSEEIILVARRLDRLNALADEIHLRSPACKVTSLSADLANSSQREEFVNSLQRDKLEPQVLINNAGLGDHGDIVSCDLEKIRTMIEVNIMALVHLTRAFLPFMVRTKRGTVVNISSVASLLPLPGIGIYAATKAFVTSFSEALRAELDGTGVKVVNICPGPIKTEFGSVAKRPGEPDAFQNPGVLEVDLTSAVREMVTAILKQKPSLIPGLLPRIALTTASWIPLFILRPLLCRAYQPEHKRV